MYDYALPPCATSRSWAQAPSSRAASTASRSGGSDRLETIPVSTRRCSTDSRRPAHRAGSRPRHPTPISARKLSRWKRAWSPAQAPRCGASPPVQNRLASSVRRSVRSRGFPRSPTTPRCMPRCVAHRDGHRLPMPHQHQALAARDPTREQLPPEHRVARRSNPTNNSIVLAVYARPDAGSTRRAVPDASFGSRRRSARAVFQPRLSASALAARSSASSWPSSRWRSEPGRSPGRARRGRSPMPWGEPPGRRRWPVPVMSACARGGGR